ncbi:adhesin HecA-like repeat protein [Variovorax boronicumulans]|uniref:hypothetical protein n=1 Tax=Variovorax boronicumulans TaxID=436515 RepID=UPI00278090B6|nr:hypothetical protein [Variovorax boronicumulans]MDP9993815.1 adhesin HecA-like repeat protein [Variovorax boronicumulans]MDQ0005320.1 adhesin HecA-like repeat protein [Variovorax boronicumulans]
MAPPSPGTITATGSILNDGGHIYAGGPTRLQSATINNNDEPLSLDSVTVIVQRVSGLRYLARDLKRPPWRLRSDAAFTAAFHGQGRERHV